MAQVVVRHSEDGFIIRHVADDTGHIFVPRQFACPLPPVARYDLIASALTGAHQGGLVDAACPHRRHQPFHYVSITDPDKQWLKQDDAYMAAQLRQSASSAELQKQPVNEQAPYDGKDLAFAGIYAKTLSQQLQNPTWNINESDAALGQHLAEQYGALKTSAGSAGISEKLSNMLNSSFDPFMDRLMDSLDAIIDQNRGWVAEKPWMSGTIRTNYIDRESVYRSFQNAIFKA